VAEAYRQLLRDPSGSLIMQADNDREELTMTWLLLNIPLAALFFALWVGIPLWMVIKHPDTGPAPASPQERALTRLPERHRVDAEHRRAA
jgi:hypothetical protein